MVIIAKNRISLQLTLYFLIFFPFHYFMYLLVAENKAKISYSLS